MNQLPARFLLNQERCVRGVGLVQIGRGITAHYQIVGFPSNGATSWASKLPDTRLSLLKREGFQPGGGGKILVDKRQPPDLGWCLAQLEAALNLQPVLVGRNERSNAASAEQSISLLIGRSKMAALDRSPVIHVL